jgi:enoyl-CoA hydratase
MSEIILDEPLTGVRRITLNAPERLNAFSFEMYEELLTILEAIRYETRIRVVVLTGAGRGFCSGHYVGGPGTAGWIKEPLGTIHRDLYNMLKIAQIPLAMRSLPQPVIAAVNGTVAGVGYALALAADIAIAGQSAKYVNAFHNVGTASELGVTYLLTHAVGSQRAAEILLSSRAVLAEEAARIGMVARMVPDEKLMEDVLALADDIIQSTPLGIWMTKHALHLTQSAGSYSQALELETRGVMLSRATEDTAEKRAARQEKRRPVFRNR